MEKFRQNLISRHTLLILVSEGYVRLSAFKVILSFRSLFNAFMRPTSEKNIELPDESIDKEVL